jgi:hypothetical protein
MYELERTEIELYCKVRESQYAKVDRYSNMIERKGVRKQIVSSYCVLSH